MAKVTYLLGAGASYGERDKENNILRGMPVVSELGDALSSYITFFNGLHPFTSFSDLGITSGEAVVLKNFLTKLIKICKSYPTIDTYAKQLYITKRNEENMLCINGENSYNTLKRLLSAAFLLLQDENIRDLRYDGFIASLINEQREFPPMTILSWNYDIQFEMAYSGYYKVDRYIPSLWKELNVLNKTFYTEYDETKPFAIIKINGTALFTDSDREKLSVRDITEERLSDVFYGGGEESKYKRLWDFINHSNYHNTLSYAWEKSNKVDIELAIKNRVHDTEDLIIIGYSFPYVNDKIDRNTISNMPSLKRVYIQDPNFDDIKERIESMLQSNNNVEFIKKGLKQFYIPSSFN